MRGGTGQMTDNWGLDAQEGPYEDLVGFLTDAGKGGRKPAVARASPA